MRREVFGLGAPRVAMAGTCNLSALLGRSREGSTGFARVQGPCDD
jgi:hypothetical protein